MSARPNFFIAIRLACPAFADAVVAVQDQAVQRAPHLGKCRMQKTKLHLTGFVLSLDNADLVNRAGRCLEEFQDDLNKMMSSLESKEVYFNSLGAFTNKVLFASPVESDTVDILTKLVTQLEERFVEQGLLNDAKLAKNSWQPHATVLKTSYDRKNGSKLKINPQDYEGLDIYLQRPAGLSSSDALTNESLLEETGWSNENTKGDAAIMVESTPVHGSTVAVGQQGICVPLTTLDLLSMQEVQADGYYKSYAQIFF